MEKVLKVINVNDYAHYVGAPELHPLVSVIHYDELEQCRHALSEYGVYGFFLMKESPYTISYGGGNYRFESGSLMCVAPGQKGGVTDDGEIIHIKGWAMLFHPDILAGTHLERRIKDYHYFSYYSNEALKLSADEWARLERYYAEGKHLESGIPSVRYCAGELFISPNYFGDLMRVRTGESATQYIRHFLMEKARAMLENGYRVSEVSETLGFEYPQHFTRMFKKEYGVAPSKMVKDHA